MIDTISLNFGSSTSATPIEFQPGRMTIFVGPNNSGKSLLLKEISSRVGIGDSGTSEDTKILSEILINALTDDEIREILLTHRTPESANFPIQPGGTSVGKIDFANNKLIQVFNSPIQHLIDAVKTNETFKRIFLSLFSLKIDGIIRLNLADQKDMGDLIQGGPANILSILLKNRPLRERVRSLIYEAFQLYIALDICNGGKVRVRVSQIEPTEIVETSVSEEAIAFHTNAPLLTDQGDGLRAYLGVLLTVMCADFKIMLLDEPEAFLHPPLAQNLGLNLARVTQERSGNLLVSTHSASFVMGCIQSGVDINIVRLTHRNGSSTARLLPPAEVRDMMRNPVMKSAGVLSALFHDGVVVTEDDTDRVFYQEINERLISSGRSNAKGSLFLNANGKSSLRKIVAPLRKLGIPVAVVSDFDLLFESADLYPLLGACNIPEAIVESLKIQREALLRSIDQTTAKDRGLEALTGSDKASAIDLLNRLGSYGIFPATNGEMESWLSELNIPGKKSAWFWTAMDKLGTDPNSAQYTRPGSGGVWSFIEKVAQWISNPAREGMPE